MPCTTPQKLMPDDPVDVLHLEVDEVAGERDAGVVDDHVDPAELRRPRRRRTPRTPRGRRRRAGRCAPPGARLLGEDDGLGEALLVDVGQREQGALAGEVERERAADAGAGSGDDDDLVFRDFMRVPPRQRRRWRPGGRVRSYLSTSKRERWPRNVNVCPGQSVVLLPNLSRYQLRAAAGRSRRSCSIRSCRSAVHAVLGVRGGLDRSETSRAHGAEWRRRCSAPATRSCRPSRSGRAPCWDRRSGTGWGSRDGRALVGSHAVLVPDARPWCGRRDR